MPMSKNYSSKVLSFIFRCFAFCFFLVNAASIYSQGMACNAGVNMSLDTNCEAIIDATYILKGEPNTASPSDYKVIILNLDGTTPDSLLIMSSSVEAGPYIFSNMGTYVKFDRPGKYKVSIVRNGDEITCWGILLVEDKLLPFTLECACPETATVVPELCKFSCAAVTDFMGSDSLAKMRGVNPVFKDNCGDIGQIEYDDKLVQDTICGNWCIIRTWRTLVEDANGHLEYKNLGCVQKFLFEGVGIDAVFPPKKKIVVECGTDIDPESLRNYFSNKTLFPSATPDSGIVAAYPFLRDTISGDTILFHEVGRGLTPGSQDDLCKLTATHTDMSPIEICGTKSYKFVRRWDILEWCDNETKEYFQVIKLMDTTDPYFEIPDTIPAGMTDPWTCEGDIMVPTPDSLSDNCSTLSELSWLAYVLDGANRIEANASNNYKLSGLSPGQYDVIYVVEDPCENDAIKQSLLIITDEVKPIALSKHEIRVTFTEFGGDCTAKIFPDNVDAGSFDACGTVDLSIRRKGIGTYGPYVKFTQDDITDVSPAGIAFGIVNVELRVLDKDGNFNITWTRVRLEDKNASIETVCGDRFIKLTCEDDIDRAIDTTYKPTARIRACQDRDLEVVAMRRSSTVDSRCHIGTVIVDYKLKGSTDTICTKTFTLGDIDSLSIIWPTEEIEVTCSQTNFGEVTLSNEACNLLFVSEDIQPFELVSSGKYCKKLVRELTVIDWCTYVPNQGDTIGIYKFRQVIKVVDEGAPTITCENVSLTAGDNCEIVGFQLVATAQDESMCGDVGLVYTAAIDTDGNGTYDLELNPVETAGGDVMAVVNTPLGVGIFNVKWTATDECNNVGMTICTITIEDNKAPTPQCITTISTAVMNTTGEVGIWAKDFNLGSGTADACGGAITFSFSETDRNVPNMNFTCADIPNGVSEVITIKVYVWDESDNVDFCTVMIRIDDNSDVCPDQNEGSALIGGRITSRNGEDLESAEVQVTAVVDQVSNMKMTDINGQYAFSNNAMMNRYEVSASKSDDYLNGISTLDIILMQRHILALSNLEDPLQIVAADVNGDERITALDLVEMRRLLLGKSEVFSAGASWKFIAANQTFEDPNHPWPLQDVISIGELDHNMKDQDFLAIKLGDVNGNAIANSALVAGGRNYNQHALLIEDRNVNAGDEITISLDLNSIKNIVGLQLAFNLEGGTWMSIASGDINIEATNVMISGPSAAITWNSERTIKNAGFVSLMFKSNRSGKLSEMIYLDKQKLAPQAYAGTEISVTDLDIAWSTTSKSNEAFEVFQNVPNPWDVETTVGFRIKAKGVVELAVFDVTGRQILGTSAVFSTGYNEFRINQSELSESGVLYYQLSYDNKVATRKMIVLE